MSNTLENSSIGSSEDRASIMTGAIIAEQHPLRTTSYDALVLDARLKQSLAAVRSLGSRGLRVAAMCTIAGVPAFSSRWCRAAFLCSANEGDEACYDYLARLLDQIDARVLITSSDATIALIRRHRQALEQRVRLALASETVLDIVTSKERTWEMAQQLGIRVPRSIGLESVDDLRAVLGEIGLPAMIKPVESWLWNEQTGAGVAVTAQLATSFEEARRIVETFARLECKSLVQEFIEGERQSISYIYAQGQIYARCAQWHTHIVGGQSARRQTISPPPDIDEPAERLVRAIGLEGCSEAEFRRGRDGRPYLMEINPRLWASTELAVRAGVDFPYLLYQWACGEQITPVKSYRVGTRLRFLKGEYTAALVAVKQRGRPGATPPLRALLDLCLGFFTPTGYDYLDWRDPLPALSATLGFVRSVLRRIMQRIIR